MVAIIQPGLLAPVKSGVGASKWRGRGEKLKLSVIGLGQCGCNIADELYAVNNYASSFFNRRLEILTDAFAINTDETDLGGFKNIPKDKSHRILIGTLNAHGHGVGKINADAS